MTHLQVVVRPPSQPSWFPWPRRTIVVVVILLAFVVMLTVIGAPPLVAVGACHLRSWPSPAMRRRSPSRLRPRVGRPEKPIAGKGPVADLARALRELRARAGTPAYKRLSTRTNYSNAVLAAAAAGNRCPTWDVTRSLVQACDGDPADVRPLWEQADLAERAARHAERLGNVSPMPRRKQAERRAAAPDPWKATTTAGYIHLLRALRAWGGNPGHQAVDLAGRSAAGWPVAQLVVVLRRTQRA